MSDPAYYRIPASTPAKVCQGCEAPVYQVMTEHGRKLVSARFDHETRSPTVMQHGVGVDHQTWDCPEAKRHQERERNRSKSSRMQPGQR